MYLVSLNPLLFKNIAYVALLKHFACVFVFTGWDLRPMDFKCCAEGKGANEAKEQEKGAELGHDLLTALLIHKWKHVIVLDTNKNFN